MAKDREAWCHKESDMTDQLNNNEHPPPSKKIDLVGAADKKLLRDFPSGLVVKTSPSNAGARAQSPVIPHALQPKQQSIKQKQYCNTVNKDFLNGQHEEKKVLKKLSILRKICGERTALKNSSEA